MAPFKVLVLLWLLLVTGGAQAIPLQLESNRPGSILITLQGRLDGQPYPFKLDTGAFFSSVIEDDFTKKYRARGIIQHGSLSDRVNNCDRIRVNIFYLFNVEYSDFDFARCKSDLLFNLLGMDALNGHVWLFNFYQMQLVPLNSAPPHWKYYPLKKLSHGHISIPLKIEGREVNAMVDTGGQQTVVDLLYIKQNQHLFTRKREETAYDLAGKPVPVTVYAIRSLEVGTKKYQDVEVLGVNSLLLRAYLGANTPVVLGNDIFVRSNWVLDLKSNQWAVFGDIQLRFAK